MKGERVVDPERRYRDRGGENCSFKDNYLNARIQTGTTPRDLLRDQLTCHLQLICLPIGWSEQSADGREVSHWPQADDGAVTLTRDLVGLKAVKFQAIKTFCSNQSLLSSILFRKINIIFLKGSLILQRYNSHIVQHYNSHIVQHYISHICECSCIRYFFIG